MHGVNLPRGDMFQKVTQTSVIIGFLTGIQNHESRIQCPLVQCLLKQIDFFAVVSGHLFIVGITFLFPDPS